jgi:hypothetical protein
MPTTHGCIFPFPSGALALAVNHACAPFSFLAIRLTCSFVTISKADSILSGGTDSISDNLFANSSVDLNVNP